MKILIYCVTVTKDGDPPPPYTADESFAGRAARLKELVQAGFAKLDIFREQNPIPQGEQADIVNAAKPLYVFTAPEWLFRVRKDQHGTLAATEYFTAAHRQRYRELLASVSTRGDADVLVVAGSMLWIQPADPAARKQLAEATEKYVLAKEQKYGAPERARPAKRTEREQQVLGERKAVYEGNAEGAPRLQ